MLVTHFARRPARRLAQLAFILSSTIAASSAALAQGEVNIYSYREPGLIDPLLKAFTEKTGIKTNVVFASAGLNERLAAEGLPAPQASVTTTGMRLRSAPWRTVGSRPTSMATPTIANAVTCASRSANSRGVPSNADIESLSKTASEALGASSGTS